MVWAICPGHLWGRWCDGDARAPEFNKLTVRPNRPGEVAASVELALVTDDVAAAYAKALAAGATEVSAPEQKPWGQTVSYVRDRDGVLVELCSPMG